MDGRHVLFGLAIALTLTQCIYTRECPGDVGRNASRLSNSMERVYIRLPQEVYPRYDILSVVYKPQLRRHLDLLIQALLRIQDRPSLSPVSFYQLASIHGQPYQAWDDVRTQDEKLSKLEEPINLLVPGKLSEFAGYCWHASILFPTWHRAYTLLYEQEIRSEAMAIAFEYDKEKRREYIEAAQQLRVPYWDWAGESTAKSGLPEFLLLEEVEVYTPQGRRRVRNPFESYTFPEDVFKGVYGHERGARGENIRVGTSPSLRGDRVARHPTEDLQNDHTKMQDDLIQEVTHYIRPAVDTLLTDGDVAQSWARFASHRSTHSHVRPRSDLKDLEGIHDTVHDIVGGIIFAGDRGFPGHMSDVNVAAYDPLFILVHTNLDRITGAYQRKNPDSWIELTEELHIKNYMAGHDGINVSSTTPLWPFRKSPEAFFDSDDLRNITTLGYTYPELIPEGLDMFNYTLSLRNSTLEDEFRDCEAQLSSTSASSKFEQIAHLFRKTHQSIFKKRHALEGRTWCPHSSLPWCRSTDRINGTTPEKP